MTDELITRILYSDRRVENPWKAPKTFMFHNDVPFQLLMTDPGALDDVNRRRIGEVLELGHDVLVYSEDATLMSDLRDYLQGEYELYGVDGPAGSVLFSPDIPDSTRK